MSIGQRREIARIELRVGNAVNRIRSPDPFRQRCLIHALRIIDRQNQIRRRAGQQEHRRTGDIEQVGRGGTSGPDRDETEQGGAPPGQTAAVRLRYRARGLA